MSQTCLNQSNSISIEREQKFSEAANDILNELVLTTKSSFPDDLLCYNSWQEPEEFKKSLIIMMKTITGDI